VDSVPSAGAGVKDWCKGEGLALGMLLQGLRTTTILTILVIMSVNGNIVQYIAYVIYFPMRGENLWPFGPHTHTHDEYFPTSTHCYDL
jgi:hypothetical protein